MKHLQPVTALILLFLLIGCSGGGTEPAEPNENLYGTWVETQTLDEVIFRKDGTVNWNGTEGSYEFLFDNGYSFLGQEFAYGSSRIEVELPDGWFSDRTFDIKGIGPSDSNPDDWDHDNRIFLRKGSFNIPDMPSRFERIPDKLANGSTSEDDFDPTRLALATNLLSFSSNQLLFKRAHRFDKGLKRWVNQCIQTYVGPQLIYCWNDDQVSLDGGITWKSVLPIAKPNSIINVPSAFIELVGTDIFVYKIVRGDQEVQYDDGSTGTREVCEREELWMLDATKEQPSLQFVDNFDCADGTIYSFLDEAIIRLSRGIDPASGGTTVSYFISHDRGQTWDDWSPSPNSYNIGYAGYAQEGSYSKISTLHWYDVDTQAWITHSVEGFQKVLGDSQNRDGLYFKRGQEIHKWHPDGTETLITTVPSEDFDARIVGDDLYVSTIFGLWRMQL